MEIVFTVQKVIQFSIVTQCEDCRFSLDNKGNYGKEYQLGILSVTEESVHQAEVVLAIEDVTEEAAEQLPYKLGD